MLSLSNTPIDSDFESRFPMSRELANRARAAIPSGVNHDGRRILPFPIYIDRALGARKWDVDGNEYIDLSMGHGSMLLGHGHADVVHAATEQIGRVLHPSAPTSAEVEWAELVKTLVPQAELVRFVVSGTEATLLAMRLCRAYTGRDSIVKVQGHYHGWQDYAQVGYLPPYAVPSSAGIPKAVQGTIRVVRNGDLDAIRGAISSGNVAAVFVEPDGAGGGQAPASRDYMLALRDITQQYDTLLVFDEVITGFRFAPGGAQQHWGIDADICTYAKAIAGGVPAGAVAGRANVMSAMVFRDDPSWDRISRVRHQGTYSGYPLAAAVGIATLKLLADGSVQDHAAAMADRFKDGANRCIAQRGLRGFVYGTRSIIRILLGDDLPRAADPSSALVQVGPERLLEGIRQPVAAALQKGLLLEGLDILGGNHGYTSLAHRSTDVDEAIAAFDMTLRRLTNLGYLSGSHGR
jgi:glutamate-1-semialdehyde 2,1-aminomutase